MILFFIMVTVAAITTSTAQDIVGCGGFVQSNVPIAFQKVEVC